LQTGDDEKREDLKHMAKAAQALLQRAKVSNLFIFLGVFL
jgi:hypothetical protein